jgi:hypothetical protein
VVAEGVQGGRLDAEGATQPYIAANNSTAGTTSETQPQATDQPAVKYITSLPGPPGLEPYGILQEVQVMLYKGEGRLIFTGKPKSESRLSIAARNWLLEQSREELEARGLHVRKGLDLSKLTDYDMHVHYHNETVGKGFKASPIYLALISAITGWRPDPTVRHN